jgi:hypothetical protein
VTAPGTGSLTGQLTELKKRLAELARAAPQRPACVVTLGTDTVLPVTTNVFASTTWATTDDTTGLVTFPAASPALITVAVDGFYCVRFHASASGAAAGQTFAVKVLLNSLVSAGSIATDATDYPAYGNDGAVCDAVRDRVHLSAGDVLRWTAWSSAAATLNAATFGVPTDLTVRYLGSS